MRTLTLIAASYVTACALARTSLSRDPPAEYRTCTSSEQQSLRYNISIFDNASDLSSVSEDPFRWRFEIECSEIENSTLIGDKRSSEQPSEMFLYVNYQVPVDKGESLAAAICCDNRYVYTFLILIM